MLKYGFTLVLVLVLTACPMQPPTPIIQMPADGSISSSGTPSISGIGVAGATITVFEAQSKICTAVVDQNNAWICVPTIALSQQQHTIYALQTDNGGNTSVASETVSFGVKFVPLTLEWNTNNRKAVQDSSGMLLFTPLTYSDIDDIAGGFRYLTVTFEVNNLGTKALENLTLCAITTSDSVGGTAINNVLGFPDAEHPIGVPITEPSVAQNIFPTHGTRLGTHPEPDPNASNFQAFSSNEASFFEQQAKNQGLLGVYDHVLDYGFVTQVRRLEPNLKTLISVAVKLPRKFTNLPKPYKFKLNFLIVEDPVLRVARGLGETTNAALARALALGTPEKPAQLVLIGSDTDAPVDPKITVLRLPSVRIGTAPTLLPIP